MSQTCGQVVQYLAAVLHLLLLWYALVGYTESTEKFSLMRQHIVFIGESA